MSWFKNIFKKEEKETLKNEKQNEILKPETSKLIYEIFEGKEIKKETTSTRVIQSRVISGLYR